MPWLIILSMVSATVVGLSFNLDFKIVKNNNDSAMGFNNDFAVGFKQAQADIATTSVRVLNAPPEFSISAPAEDPISTSTSPINIGDNIGFKATANDPEDDEYYLIVCTINAVTPGDGGGAPSCGGGGDQLCVSGLTNDTEEASCTHTVQNQPGESLGWFAFACDNHTTEADCSDGHPGTGDSGTPFYINHAPLFSEVNTTVNNQPPYGTWTVTASTTDSDTEGGNDMQHLYVCLTNDWATSTGCAIELCHGTSTAPADPSCSFGTTTPAMHGSYTYYAFVMDWHNFASASNPQTNTYTVINVAPFVNDVVLTNSNDIQLSLKYAPEFEASTTFQVIDHNGCLDLESATATIYWQNASGGYSCTADNDDCYQIGSVGCEMVAGSCSGSLSSISYYTCTTTMKFHAQPTDADSNYPATAWYAAAAANDGLLISTTTVSSSGVDVKTNSGLDVSETEIAYGQIRGAQNSGSTNATTTIENLGNSPINVDVDGVDMLKDGGGDEIEVYNQIYGLNPFSWPLAQYTLYSTSTQEVDIAAPKPTTATTGVEDEIYWGIAIPGGKTSGEYYGSNTIAVIIDPLDW